MIKLVLVGAMHGTLAAILLWTGVFVLIDTAFGGGYGVRTTDSEGNTTYTHIEIEHYGSRALTHSIDSTPTTSTSPSLRDEISYMRSFDSTEEYLEAEYGSAVRRIVESGDPK